LQQETKETAKQAEGNNTKEQMKLKKNSQTKEETGPPHMIIENKIRVVCLQPPICLKLNMICVVVEKL